MLLSGETVSTHSRLKAAGRLLKQPRRRLNVSTHSRLKAAGKTVLPLGGVGQFQHTAA